MRHVVLLCAAAALVSTAALARQPSGEGDPKEEHFMRLDAPTGSLGGARLCKTNAEWAKMKADGIVLDDFGNPKAAPDARGVADHGCETTTSGAHCH